VSSEGEEGGPEVIVLPKEEGTKAEEEAGTEDKPEQEENLETEGPENFEDI
jgi:hypothetical protein